MIKTFKGILADGAEQRIRLSSKQGKIGYRIVSFEFLPNQPGDASSENVLKVFKITQPTLLTGGAKIDFSDGNLLAALYYTSGVNASQTTYHMVMFDEEIFNQDIFITHTDNSGSTSANYLLKLESMPLTDNAASVSTLRDIRLNPQVGG
jgi:hypothetical protein